MLQRTEYNSSSGSAIGFLRNGFLFMFLCSLDVVTYRCDYYYRIEIYLFMIL
jgi:hypothetical protein